MNRTKYIIVFHDISQANPESNNLYKAYLFAESLMSAELMAKLVKGTVVGVMDDDSNECYFESGMEEAVRLSAQSKYVFNTDGQKRRRKNLGD